MRIQAAEPFATCICCKYQNLMSLFLFSVLWQRRSSVYMIMPNIVIELLRNYYIKRWYYLLARKDKGVK